jgi:hypothetical protein
MKLGQRVSRVSHVDIKVDNTIQISNGEVFLPHLSLVEVGGGHYFITHKKNCIPNGSVLLGNDKVSTENYKANVVSDILYDMVDTGIATYNEQENKDHLNPFTYLYTYVKFKFGIDLFKNGVFEL